MLVMKKQWYAGKGYLTLWQDEHEYPVGWIPTSNEPKKTNKPMEILHIDIKTEGRSMPDSRYYTVVRSKGVLQFSHQGDDAIFSPCHEEETFEVVEIAKEGSQSRYVGISEKHKELFEELLGHTQQGIKDMRSDAWLEGEYVGKDKGKWSMREHIRGLPWWKRLFKKF